MPLLLSRVDLLFLLRILVQALADRVHTFPPMPLPPSVHGV